MENLTLDFIRKNYPKGMLSNKEQNLLNDSNSELVSFEKGIYVIRNKTYKFKFCFGHDNYENFGIYAVFSKRQISKWGHEL